MPLSSEALLSPQEYWKPSCFEQEQIKMFDSSWHWVCRKNELLKDGAYCSRSILGVPIVVWNWKGNILAYRNICLHRQCILVPYGRGIAPSLVCQYHGWVYDEMGRVNFVPDRTNFSGDFKLRFCLDRFPVETLGDAVFLSLRRETPSLRDSLGSLSEELDRYFNQWKLFYSQSVKFSVNWKIIIENVIESYHVPMVHPKIFRFYRTEKFHDHTITPFYTRYLDLLPWETQFIGKVYKYLAKLMVNNPNPNRFIHSHVFPNVHFYYGDLFSSFSIVEPVGPTDSVVHSFCYVPKKLSRTYFSQPLQKLLEPQFKRAFLRVFNEDARIVQDVQEGLRQADCKAILSRREERILAFQKYLVDL